jgi:predicted nucleic acid-binding protein
MVFSFPSWAMRRFSPPSPAGGKESLLSKREYGQLRQRFRDDWMFELAEVELTAPVLLFVPNLVTEHPLKASDAIHLASALWFGDRLRLGVSFGPANRSLTFVYSDKRLKNAASSVGLEVVDPEDQS